MPDNDRTFTLEDLAGRTPDEIRDVIDTTKAQIRDLMYGNLGELRSRSEQEDKALQIHLAVHERAEQLYEEHRKVKEVLDRRPKAIEYSRLGGQRDDPYADVRRLTVAEARDGALRVLDDRVAASHLKPYEKDEVEHQIRSSTHIARRVLVTENEHYREAWMRLVTDPQGVGLLTNEQREAVRAYQEYRGASEGTTTAGGFGIPVFIDPSIIMTAQGSGNPFLNLARQVDVNTNIWKGASSAGVSWSFDSEAAAVSDDMATLAQPTVTVF